MPSADRQKVEGVGARRAALQMLDAVLRRGRTLDAAAQGVRGLSGADKALALAIAGEALRRLPDLDALIAGRANVDEVLGALLARPPKAEAV